MTTLRVGIASYEKMKERTRAIARGELKPGPRDPKVWFPSTESMARILSSRNQDLLDVIRRTSPQSSDRACRGHGPEKAESLAHHQNHATLWAC